MRKNRVAFGTLDINSKTPKRAIAATLGAIRTNRNRSRKLKE